MVLATVSNTPEDRPSRVLDTSRAFLPKSNLPLWCLRPLRPPWQRKDLGPRAKDKGVSASKVTVWFKREPLILVVYLRGAECLGLDRLVTQLLPSGFSKQLGLRLPTRLIWSLVQTIQESEGVFLHLAEEPPASWDQNRAWSWKQGSCLSPIGCRSPRMLPALLCHLFILGNGAEPHPWEGIYKLSTQPLCYSLFKMLRGSLWCRWAEGGGHGRGAWESSRRWLPVMHHPTLSYGYLPGGLAIDMCNWRVLYCSWGCIAQRESSQKEVPHSLGRISDLVPNDVSSSHSFQKTMGHREGEEGHRGDGMPESSAAQSWQRTDRKALVGWSHCFRQAPGGAKSYFSNNFTRGLLDGEHIY